MRDHITSIPENVFMKVNRFIKETDIRVLVFAPPIIAFVWLIIGAFTMNLLPNAYLYQPIKDILLGILLLFPCFSGYAEIRKKEMPGYLGIYKGNLAVISGVFIVILFGLFGITILIHGISTLFGMIL